MKMKLIFGLLGTLMAGVLGWLIWSFVEEKVTEKGYATIELYF